MSRQMRVDFYRVAIEPSHGPSFQTLLHYADSQPAGGKNWHVRDGHIIRLHSLHHVATPRIIGNMVRLRMEDIPQKGDVKGVLGPLGLTTDEGVAEETAFTYIVKYGVIALQRNKFGVPASMLASYFKSISNDAVETLYLDPVLTPDAIQRMEQLVDVRRLNVRVAGAINAEAFGPRRREYSVKAMNEALTYFRSPTIEMSVSIGRKRKGSLDFEAAKDFVRGCVAVNREHPGNVERLEVSGRDPDGAIDVIDMLKMQMSETMEVAARGRMIPLDTRISALSRAVSNRMADLAILYGTPS